MSLNGEWAGSRESERERGKSGVIPTVGKTVEADLASLIGWPEEVFQKSFPNGLTDGEIKKSPGSSDEPGLLSKLLAYLDQNKWRAFMDSNCFLSV